MTTIATQGDFKIEFNGSSTYFVTDNNGTAWFCTSSKVKATNYMKKVA